MNVYWFQDSKTGHLKQVQALLDQLKKAFPKKQSSLLSEDNIIED